VVDGVGDEQVISDVSGNLRRQGQQPLRLVEDLSRAPPRALGLEITLEVDHLMVRRVGDDDAAVGQGDELAGEGQGRRPRRWRQIRPVPHSQRALLAVLGDELTDQRRESGSVALARHRGDDVPLGVDHDEGRPGPRGVGLPRRELRVVEHRVVHGIPLHGCLDGGGIALVLELRGVHAHEDELVGEPRLDRPQLVQHVEAVDAAERPEVEDDDPATQAAEGDLGAAGVEPAPADQLGRPHAGPRAQGGGRWVGRHVVANAVVWERHSRRQRAWSGRRRSASTGKLSRQRSISLMSMSTLRTSCPTPATASA